MTDEPKPEPDQPGDPALPESLEGDPKSETVIRRSEALKRMIEAFQVPPESVVDAALDIDRSVDPAAPLAAASPAETTSPEEALLAQEKTFFRPPSLEATISSASKLKKTDEHQAVEPESPMTVTPPLSVALDAARRLEHKRDEPVKEAELATDVWDVVVPPAEAPTPVEPVKPAAAKLEDSKASGIVPAVRPEPKVIDATSITARQDNALTGSPNEAPWTLQQFFNGEIDLDVELSKRFPTMPMLSIIKFRTLGTNSSRRVATLSTQDGAASLIVDADVATKVIQLSFTLGSMLTLRFGVTDLSDMDRNRWVELMRRDQGGLAFLWGPQRWAQDYMICIARKYFTNLYCFSPHNFEAGVRLTPAVTKQLLDWLEELWKATFNTDEDAPPLLTW